MASDANDTATVKLLLEKEADVNEKDGGGNTALMNAAALGNVSVMKMLLAKGADVNAVTAPYVGPGVKNGPTALGSFTPLIVAAAHGGSEAVKLLLDAGAKVDAQDVRGMTPLMLAISTDHPDASVVRLLLESKADTNIKDLNGETRSIGPPSSASLRLCRRWASKPTALKSNRRLCACQFGGRPMRSRHREKRCAPATHQRHVFQRGRLRFLPCTESDGNGRRCRARHRSARR